MSYRIAVTPVSSNPKTGPIPVTTTSAETCWDGCPFMGQGCYAGSGPVSLFWKKVTEARKGFGMAWDEGMTAIAALLPGTLWRHNQAGDLPGQNGAIDRRAFFQLVRANKGKRGFTFTHKPMTRANARMVKLANAAGFTVNLSANNLAHADTLAALNVGPVAVVLPAEQMTATVTPEGRKVAICPAVRSKAVQCATCGLCAMKDRKAIIGFPAHGTSKKKAQSASAAFVVA